MKRKSKRTKGMEEARPFAGMSQVNPNAAGEDIGAVEIVVCVAGDETTQIVKAFGNYYYPDALSGHCGSTGDREMAQGTSSKNGGDGKHRRVLDPIVRGTGTAGFGMPAGQFTLLAQSTGEEERY